MIERTVTKPRLTSEERRASIVEAACRMFSTKGFRGTTTRELAAEVGVTEPVLYEHFRTKSDLYAAIIESKSCEGMEALAARLRAYAELGDDRGYFTQLGKMILNWYTEDPSFVRLLLFSNLENHELKDLFHQRTEPFFRQIVAYIESRMARNAMRKMDPAIAARAFFGMVAHYALTGLLFGCWPIPESREEIVRQMVDVFLNGMAKQETA
jgi:AcrR family transcriptional regulator